MFWSHHELPYLALSPPPLASLIGERSVESLLPQQVVVGADTTIFNRLVSHLIQYRIQYRIIHLITYFSFSLLLRHIGNILYERRNSRLIITRKKTFFPHQLIRNTCEESSTMSMFAILVFDLCETVLISALLAVSIPIACVTYWKLLFVSPLAENFTFKLIVLNGATVSLQLGQMNLKTANYNMNNCSRFCTEWHTWFPSNYARILSCLTSTISSRIIILQLQLVRIFNWLIVHYIHSHHQYILQKNESPFSSFCSTE